MKNFYNMQKFEISL